MVKAKQLVETLLEADASADPHERAYARLLKLYTRRGELHSEQKWHADFGIALHRKHVDQANIKSLDIHDGKCFGLWLKQGDYGAKIQRRAENKSAQAKALDAKVERGEMYQHDRENSVPYNASPSEVSAYYVPFNPPLWVPASIRDQL